MTTHPMGERPMTMSPDPSEAQGGINGVLLGLAGEDFDRETKELFVGDTMRETNGDMLGDTEVESTETCWS